MRMVPREELRVQPEEGDMTGTDEMQEWSEERPTMHLRWHNQVLQQEWEILTRFPSVARSELASDAARNKIAL